MIISTTLGQIQGTVVDGVAIYRGIPYAEAPVGELRYKNAVPKTPWEDVLEATTFGPKCPQLRIPVSPENAISQDEDCLYLNVYAPTDTIQKKPVFVWIYGGALASGEGSTDIYDGGELVTNGDVILVTFNYRVGVLGGFYGLEALVGSDIYQNNCGLTDVITALKFVKENIAAFGGDPDQITIGGESAGASLTALLLCMPEANGLFHRAIMESTYPFDPDVPDPAVIAEQLLQAGGYDKEQAKEFLAQPAANILDALSKSCNGNLLVCHASIQRADCFAKSLPDLLRQMCNDVPVLIGYNHDEGAIFIGPEGDVDAMNRITRDLFEETIVSVLNADTHTKPVYLYRYDFVPAPLKQQGMGAIHSAEMPCVFHNLNCPGAAMMQADPVGAEQVSRAMHRAWIQFIRGNEPWDAYCAEKPAYMLFDVQSEVRNDSWRI